MLTAEQLASAVKIPLARAERWVGHINATMGEFGIITPMQQAHWLAQIAHESARFIYVHEIASGRAYNGRVDLGNMRPEALAVAKAHGTTAGQFWRGHGLIQITGFDNHRACGDALGLDLINNPTLLELPKNAARSAGWFWKTKNLNKWADIDDVRKVTKIINGGYNGLGDRITLLTSTKQTLGVA